MGAESSCNVEECERPVISRGWCTMHYQRWKAHGDPLVVKRAKNLKEHELGYSAVHHRVKLACGLATDYRCVMCGAPATSWACFRNKSVSGTDWDHPVMYSQSIKDYAPLCGQCHHVIDHTIYGEASHLAVLTEQDVLDLRERDRISPVNRAQEARRLGVTRQTVQSALKGKSWKHLLP